MDETKQVSSLIGDIYDASLDPVRWTGALQKIGGFVGGSAAAVYSKDTVRKTGNVFHVDGIEPHFVQSYFEKYVRFDPFTTMRFFFPVGQAISIECIMPHEEFRATLFYKEWARPQGWIDFVSAALEKSRTTYAECGLFRHDRDGVTDEEARRKMRLIVPHVRRAVLIGKVVDLRKVEAAALADTLDGLAAGMFLVDASGRIVHANVSGHAMLATGDVVRAAGVRLRVCDSQAERALQDIFAVADLGDGSVGARGIALPLSAPQGQRHVAHVLPLTSGARRQAGTRYSAVAAVFVQEATAEGATPLETIADAYRLTPAELRVLMTIVEIGGVPEVAPVLGVSGTTVKTHLQRVFEKTGTKRQADLVKLVAGYMSPLAG